MGLATKAEKYWQVLKIRLHTPVDIAPLVYFRVIFGSLMVVHVARYFSHGWIRDAYVTPRMYFPYPGFDWVRVLPGPAMYWVFALMGLFAAGIAVGALYRLSATAFFLLFSYVFLIDVTRYVNHHYLMAMAALLLACAPAADEFSVDALLRRKKAPVRQAGTAPGWTVFVPACQIAIVYFYAGLAKLNGDWLQGQPLRLWFAEREHASIVAGLVGVGPAALAFSYAGAFFDLFIVPLLLYKKTRKPALAAAVGFHVINSWIFPEIGLFPWFMLAATVIFLPLRDLVPLPAFWRKAKAAPMPARHETGAGRKAAITALACAFLLLQIALPFRRFVYPGNVMWHEYGSRFSWFMKLWDKRVYDAHFYATDAAGTRLAEIPMLDFLTPAQAIKVANQPELVVKFARGARYVIKRKTGKDVEVHADIVVSLNGRPYQQMIDPSVNLATAPDGPGPWIVPLGERLVETASVKK